MNLEGFRTAVKRRPEFAEAVRTAKMDRLAIALAAVWDGEKGWQSRAWLLERVFGQQFRNSSKVELSGEVNAGGITEKDWDRIRALAKEWMEKNGR